MRLALIAISMLVLANCGSSNNSVKGVSWCSTDYLVSNFKDVVGQKSRVELVDDTELDLTPGEYVLSTLHVYFNDVDRDIRAHVEFAIDENGDATPKTRCVGSNTGQIKTDMEDYIFVQDVHSYMEVAPSGKTHLADATVTVEFSYTGEDDRIFKEPKYDPQDGGATEKALKDTFKTGYTEREQHLFFLENAYELQNKLEKPSLEIEMIQRWVKK